MALESEAANKEAMRMFGTHANLLDFGHISKNNDFKINNYDDYLKIKDGHINYDLYLHEGLDIKTACHTNTELRNTLYDIVNDINTIENKVIREKIMPNDKRMLEINEDRMSCVRRLDDFYNNCFKQEICTGIISYKDVPTNIKSIYEACVDTGAKGNDKKMTAYAKWLGAEIPERDETGRPVFDKIVDKGHTLATRDMHKGVMTATLVKSHGTGLGGGVSQRGVMTLRNAAINEILELTYPVTQSLLQSKHDPDEAKLKYSLLINDVANFWKGYVMEYNTETSKWEYPAGKAEQCTKKQWINQMYDFYTNSDHGLNVDINMRHLETVADLITGDDGKIINIYSELSPEEAVSITHNNEELLGKLREGLSRDNMVNTTRMEGYTPKIEMFNKYVGTALDQLAYKSKGIDTFVEFAEAKANLYTGEFNQRFMPTKVYANVFPMEDAKAKTFVPVDVKADTKNLNSIEEKLSKQIPVNTKYSEQVVDNVRDNNDGNDNQLSL